MVEYTESPAYRELSREPSIFETLGSPSPTLIVLLIVPLIGIGLALGASIAENRPINFAPAFQPIRNLSYPAPDFMLSDLEGNPVRLSDYKGRIVFLNFWQTGCEPCRRELPAFAEFMELQDEQGAVVLAVSFDETSEQIHNFLAANDINGIPILLDPISRARRSYGVELIPTTFVIDSAGMTRITKFGETHLEEMLTFVDAVAQNPSQ